MQHAEILFKKVIEQGEAAINEFILNRESESLFLDFKRSSDNGAGKKLSQTDRHSLAKAISGFGNSEGGVIIWGVDCSDCREDDDYADVARAKFPITDPQRFKSWVEGAISNSTIPPHTGVQNHTIITGNNKGFVVTYISKSNDTPHQVITSGKGQYHYYIRAGSDFAPTPHAVLSGMFGRRPQPSVFQMFSVEYPKIISEDPLCIRSTLGIQLFNKGPGIASDLFMTLSIFSKPGVNCELVVEPHDLENWQSWSFMGNQFSTISKPDLRLPPRTRFHPFILSLTLAPPFSKRLEIEGLCGCGQSPSFNFKLEKDGSEIESQCYEFIEQNRKGKIFNPDFWGEDDK